MIFKYPNRLWKAERAQRMKRCVSVQQCGMNDNIKLKGICDDKSILCFIQIYPWIWADCCWLFFSRFNKKSVRNENIIIGAFSLDNFQLFFIWNHLNLDLPFFFMCDVLILRWTTSKKALYLIFEIHWSANIPMRHNIQYSMFTTKIRTILKLRIYY